ncbi:gamma-glutamylcyclotransferase family protein [Halioxenophilus aromaticivorans]|uniref:Gamma-glutamylcyclotransferase n=1 Tax=Halioxenophilus aromaticivorans TaxID=1306992 RepID=A0AAV3U5T7_9ALTE
MTEFYFAYGSNMNSERMKARQVQFDRCFAGSLPNTALKFNKRAPSAGSGHANVAYAPGSRVEGVVYRVSGEPCMRALDQFESAPRAYSREIFWLSVEGKPLAAWVYIGNQAALAEDLVPERWYLNHLLAGKQYLSAKYYQQLQTTPCLDIDPPDRPVHL